MGLPRQDFGVPFFFFLFPPHFLPFSVLLLCGSDSRPNIKAFRTLEEGRLMDAGFVLIAIRTWKHVGPS